MPTSQTLQHLYSFKTFSPEFSRCLDRLIQSDEEDRYLFGLQGSELTRLVDFLDTALGIIPVTDDVSRRCLHKLQAICSHTGILPSSHIISGGLSRVGDYPVASTNLSDVWEGIHNGTKVCIKYPRITLRDRQDVEKAFYKEAVMWKRLRHPNIVPFVGVAQNPLQFVSEWMPNGNLVEYLSENPGANRIGLLLGVAEGLAYLHAKHTVHGDLKGSNVLISRRGRARLTDFGFTSVVRGLNSARVSQLQGCTLRWAAPEVIRGESGGAQEADTYAFGMVVIEVFTGRCPFSELTDPVAVSEVMEGERPNRPQEQDLTDPVWEMTERCWQEDPVLRPRMKEAVAVLRECHTLPISAAQQSTGRELPPLPSCGVSIPPPGSGGSALASSTRSLNRAGTIITLTTPSRPASPINPTSHTSGTRDVDYALPGTPATHPSIFGSNRAERSKRMLLSPICMTPGCTSPVFVGEDGTLSEYCSRTHKKWSERSCIFCRAPLENGPSDLCQHCHDNALNVAPVIIEVPEDHENYKSVAAQFKQSWRHQTTCPEVRAVYKIVSTEATLQKYHRYLDGVEVRGNFAAVCKARGNEDLQWHGTRRKCNIGDKGVTAFCADLGCSLCCILKSSFDLKFFKTATGWGRFGAGIYTSSTSSKSNDYSKNTGVASNWQALLLNKVVVGNSKKLTKDDPSLTRPPPGFDSVVGEVAPRGSLNYSELAVYNNDAIRPSYLVMYDSPYA